MTEEPAVLRTKRIKARLAPNRGSNGGFSLIVDGTTQSHVNPDDPLDLQLEYVRIIAAIIDGTSRPGPIAALHLGGGALTVPRYLAATRPDSRQHVVELYEELYGFVVQHLPVPEGSMTAQFEDARAALATLGDESFDLAIVDVFSGDVAPRHISTAEFFGELASHVAPSGVVIVNTLATRGLKFSREALATLRVGFPHVAAVTDPRVASGDRIGNVELVASASPIDSAGIERTLTDVPGTIEVFTDDRLDALVAGAKPRHD